MNEYKAITFKSYLPNLIVRHGCSYLVESVTTSEKKKKLKIAKLEINKIYFLESSICKYIDCMSTVFVKKQASKYRAWPGSKSACTRLSRLIWYPERVQDFSGYSKFHNI